MPRKPKAREPLKRAALELFVERGVHAVGIRELARHAGCSEAALYRHWASKDALVQDIFRTHLEQVRALIAGAIASASDTSGRVRAACAAAYALYDSDPLVFRFVLLVQHELARSLPPGLRVPQDEVMALAADAVARGEAQGDPALLAAALVGVFLQTATCVLYGRIPGPLSRYVEPVSALALRILGHARR
jgi:AcrR family transcriptional regulator